MSALALAGCAAMDAGDSSDARAKAVALMEKDFKTRGQANVERIKQDDLQALCTRYAGGDVPADAAKRVEAAQLATVKYPVDGHYLGDWKAGEKIAQTGTGKQWSDDPKMPGGGNCYACHELSPKELSFGTIGPSLRGYGRARGNSRSCATKSSACSAAGNRRRTPRTICCTKFTIPEPWPCKI